jgi:hypothetical protein
MWEPQGPARAPEIDMEEGLALALAYLEDPSDVPCPKCGQGQIEVVCYLDARSMEQGTVVPTSPDEDYTVVLYWPRRGRARPPPGGGGGRTPPAPHPRPPAPRARAGPRHPPPPRPPGLTGRRFSERTSGESAAPPERPVCSSATDSSST